MILTPKNWNDFQHYKDREPSWIKLHKSLLTNYEFVCLPVASKALAPMLWLLASEYRDGIIDASLDKIAFRLSMTRGDLADALTPLIDSGFFDASDTLAECEQDASLEKRRDREEKEECTVGRPTRTKATYSEDFDQKFWSPYPRAPTMSKSEAWKAWQRLGKADQLLACQAIEPYRQYLKTKPDLATVHACRFLSQRRFEGFGPVSPGEAPPARIDLRGHFV